MNKTPCLYLCSFPFVVAALLLVSSLASLAWILTYPTVMIQIQTRSLIHQFSRYDGSAVVVLVLSIKVTRTRVTSIDLDRLGKAPGHRLYKALGASITV